MPQSSCVTQLEVSTHQSSNKLCHRRVANEVTLKSNYTTRRLIAPRLSSRAIAVVRSFVLSKSTQYTKHHFVLFGFHSSVQTQPNDSEAMCVSDERNTGERQFALHSTKQYRSNESMTTLLFNSSVRANHQHPRSRNHADFAQQFFTQEQLRFGQQHAATPQIARTSAGFDFCVRCDAGSGQSAAVGLFTQSARPAASNSVRTHSSAGKYTR